LILLDLSSWEENCWFNLITYMLAYIDPGLGTLMWQVIVSAFVGLLFYLKKSRRWIVGVVKNLSHLK